jgi:hypothetical protein
MEELQRVFGYLQKYTGGSIPIDIEDPLFERETVYTTDNNGILPRCLGRYPNDMLEPKGMEAD